MSRVLIGGGSGLIGQHLSELLVREGYEVSHLSRSKRGANRFPTYEWDARAQTIDDEAIRQADYVINLAGAGIADARWTDRRKKLIIDSRTETTRLLKNSFERLNHFPRAYLSASAIGYYGDRGAQVLHEDDPPGTGFLSESCILWENAISEVAALIPRTVVFRTGIALSTRGGALEKMLLPLKGFLSTYFGDGSQYYSWIHIDDICRAYLHALRNEDIRGTFNGVAPQPVTNKELARALPAAAGKPALVVPAPAFAMKLVLGEMAHTVLDSVRCSATKLEESGFEFAYPELGPALQDLLQRKI
jgi:uncharacterized protein (TIGR01777 family)